MGDEVINNSLFTNAQVDSIIELALAEDISRGDITSEALIPPVLQGQAVILAKAEGVLAGGELVVRVFLKVDPSLKIEILIEDGAKVKKGDRVATVYGSVISILKAERTALNFLQQLSGIASQTAQYIAKTQGLGVKISDTRKTTPGLRLLGKYAVRSGGGHNHRFHLGDGILIKDNHLVAMRVLGISLRDVVAEVKRHSQGLKVEVEVSTAKEAMEAAHGGADIIMLDNMGPEEMRQVVGLLPSHVRTEASGNITLSNVRAAAISGVDIISIGALTHSPKALDFSLELEAETIKLLKE
jgi:nicotinate-nucleotide pyrophosphorylase (carboxylating)